MKKEALTKEQAKSLAYPRVLEIWDWDNSRSESEPTIQIVVKFDSSGFTTNTGARWLQAAELSDELAEAIRKQFETPNEPPIKIRVVEGQQPFAVSIKRKIQKRGECEPIFECIVLNTGELCYAKEPNLHPFEQQRYLELYYNWKIEHHENAINNIHKLLKK